MGAAKKDLKKKKVEKKDTPQPTEIIQIKDLKIGTEMLPVGIVSFEHCEPESLLAFTLNGECRNISYKDQQNPSRDIQSARTMITEFDSFMNAPMDHLVEGTKASQSEEQFLKLRFSKIAEKTTVVEEVQNFLKSHKTGTSLLADCLLITDEMVSNAIYNAPVVDLENNTSGYHRSDRTVAMDGERFGEFEVGIADEHIFLVCEDPYGTLNVKSMLARVKRCYEQGLAANINMGPGGARIGSFLIFNLCTHIYLGVKTNQKTVVACVLPVKMSGRKRLLHPKSLHYRQD